MKENTKVAVISVVYRPAIASRPLIKSPLDAYNVLKDFFPEETIHLQEEFKAMLLNQAHRVLGVYPVGVGGITSCVADVRLILSVALKTASTSIILCHNHPSSHLKPSEEDIHLTQRIKQAASLLDISIADHLILSPIKGQYYSFADEGIL